LEEEMNLGARFTKWGLGLFIFGVFLTLGPILHYLVGSQHDNGEMFMHNITLWWGCPWTLSVAVTQIGGLGMVAIGLTRMVTTRLASNPPSADGSGGPLLCIVGILGTFLVGFPGYFVFDAIWPRFYYDPVPTGKNAWLIGQGLFIVIYFIGLLRAFNAERSALNRISTSVAS
jgi:hypothetical protein